MQRIKVKKFAQVVVVEVLAVVISDGVIYRHIKLLEIPESSLKVSPIELNVRIPNIVLAQISQLRDE